MQFSYLLHLYPEAETFAYIVFASSDDAEVAKWLEVNEAKVKEFYSWSKEFKFTSN